MQTNKENRARLPELLAPAGSPEALDAAIDAQADAVYFGFSAFNARMNAENFDDGRLEDTFKKCAAYGVKTYVTLNTLVLDREAEDFIRAAEKAWRFGASGIIIADLGLAVTVKKYIPEIELHASTQLSGHNVEEAERLSSLGFSRMVLARETPLRDIKSFTEKSPIEAEVFVHGALCVSHSGQCLFSSVVGGRSGNRGECAQPCRLPYCGGYPLSLRDLCLAEHIPELIDAGVASLKIEGRMKSPEYVRAVTAVYRKLLDERRSATRDEMKYLSEIFSRGGFTDGYFTEKISKRMLGIRSESDKKSTRELAPFEKITRKIPIEITVRLSCGKPSEMTMAGGGKTVTVTGDTPEKAINAPLTRESVLKSISKLGGTPFEAIKTDISITGDVMLPVSKLNELRRKAADAFLGSCRREIRDFDITLPSKSGLQRRMRTARFASAKQISEKAEKYFDIRFLPAESFDKRANGVIIPPVIFDHEKNTVKELIESAAKNGAKYALVGNLGHISLSTDAGLIPVGDHRLNIFNRLTEAELEKTGLKTNILSPELTPAQMRDIGGDSSAVVYGRIPLMLLEKCVIREIADCDECEKSGFVYLTDRKGVRFPVRRTYDHRNIIYNSLPTYMADRQAELEKYGIRNRHFIFTVESADEVDSVISSYENGQSADFPVRRMNRKGHRNEQ